MGHTRSSGGGSGNSGTYSPEIAESIRFEEEIQSLMSPPVTGSSFTALLGLAPNQAVELLHDPPPQSPIHSPAISATAVNGFCLSMDHHKTLGLPLGCTPTFPSNAALIDRAARFSVFAAAESPEASNSGEILPAKMKTEPVDSGDRPIDRLSDDRSQNVAGNKRKEAEKSKVKASAKKSKSAEENSGGEKLPYVHVRARRGQATDSHSLAERARREKINVRMKLLQELVPGCSKISGTALVLDEIINHVQSLQRQVEFLSMRLAAVNPRIDFSGLDNILSSECGRLTAGNVIRGATALEQSAWLLDGMNNEKQQQQQMWLIDPQQQMWERDDTQQNHIFVSNPSTTSIFAYDSSVSSNPNSVSLPNQLKTEM